MVGKGEIARYEQFLLIPQCLQKTCTADTLKTEACFGKGKYTSMTRPKSPIKYCIVLYCIVLYCIRQYNKQDVAF